MVFSSLYFLFLYLPIVLLIYYIAPLRLRNAVLLVFNLIFYGWGEPKYILIMFASIAIDYTHGMLVTRCKERGNDKGARLAVASSVVFNLALLFFFKYWDFIARSLAAVGLGFLPVLNIRLPIGISFYTFQAVSYLIDVYWKDCEAASNFINFACYISLFPQLIAGPIVRYKDVNDQLISRTETLAGFNTGVRLFMVGMAKKVLLANQFGVLWDAVSANPTEAGALAAWCGAVAYSLQLYFDFSGYSDMARGLGKMLGFDFCINFNYPYISKSVTEFWRRWHISLSTWFRDYVYIPLGGNRCTVPRQILNLFVVWFLTGLWHGASWNYVLWGLYYGLLLGLGRFVVGDRLSRLPEVVKWLGVLVLVLFGTMIFKFTDLTMLGIAVKGLFGGNGNGLTGMEVSLTFRNNLFFLLFAAVASTPLGKHLRNILGNLSRRNTACFWVNAVWEAVHPAALLILSVMALAGDSYNPFLYFQF